MAVFPIGSLPWADRCTSRAPHCFSTVHETFPTSSWTELS